MKVVTRIAPSPTGYMHIGTARTALFNYLFARHHGGEFKIRIEDTDSARNVDGAVDAIFNGMKWLGLDHDGDVVFQSQREGRHREVALSLLRNGLAYKCFLTAEEAKDMKVMGEAFRSPYRDPTSLSPDLAKRLNMASYSIRFKGSTEGEVVVKDLIRGDVKFDAANLDDLVILRSDGTPTYNLAVVVDDHDMGVTHVIRGDDHLSNAAKQQMMYAALKWDIPQWAHIPLILDENGKKFSKRTGTAVTIEDYIKLGYCSDGLFNYLCRLGWGHGNDEIFSRAQAIEWFDVADVISSPARMDWNKLNHVNGYYLKEMSVATVMKTVHGEFFYDDSNISSWDIFARAITSIKDDCSNFVELKDRISPFMERIFSEDGRTVLEHPDAKTILSEFRNFIQPFDYKSKELLSEKIKEFTKVQNIQMKVLGPVMRAALTGITKAPDIGTCLYILGPTEADERMGAI